MTEHQHQHEDRGGGYCSCGAERCSLPRCDGWCVHPGGWIGPAELAELRPRAPRPEQLADVSPADVRRLLS